MVYSTLKLFDTHMHSMWFIGEPLFFTRLLNKKAPASDISEAEASFHGPTLIKHEHAYLYEVQYYTLLYKGSSLKDLLSFQSFHS